MAFSGLLTSQVGHDLGEPVRAVVRAGAAGDLGRDAAIMVGGQRVPLRPWGILWGQHWWTAEAGALPAGEHGLTLVDGAATLASAVVDVAPHRLWRGTWRTVALEQFERRTRIAALGHGTGWQDCGCDWQEANSHAAAIVGLCDLLINAGGAIDAAERTRLVAVIRQGCLLLDRLQDLGSTEGLPAGSLVHESRRARKPLVRDAVWAALAWGRAARALGGPEAAAWRARGVTAMRWWTAAPIDHQGMDPAAHGWPAGYQPPAARPTVDLAHAAWAWLELADSPDDDAGRAAVALAAQVMALQIPRRGDGPFGHVWEFPDRVQAAPVWTHNMIGPDTGETGLSPMWALSQLLARWPDHTEAARWREALLAHVDGWLLPQADASPFAIAARCHRDGWIHFGGLWHGMNAVYGLSAALAEDLARQLGRPGLRRFAAGNRQWIAGLNAGLTPEARATGCVMTWPEAETGRALPVAMIQGVGRRSAAGWMAIPGTIPNGFSAGEQFKFDVPATVAADGPSSFTDEDWITHAGGWLMAMSRIAG